MSLQHDVQLPRIIHNTIDDEDVRSRLGSLSRSTRISSKLRKTILNVFEKQQNIAKKLSPQ